MESAQVIIHQPKPTVEESTPVDEADGDRPVASSVGRDGSAKVTNAPHQPMGVRQLARCDVLKVHQHLDCVEGSILQRILLIHRLSHDVMKMMMMM